MVLKEQRYLIASNPGWVDNGDGTVSFTVEYVNVTDPHNLEGAAEKLVDVVLYLSFPGAPVLTSIENKVSLDMTPYNHVPNTLDDYERIDDTLKIKLRTDLFKEGGVLTKRHSYLQNGYGIDEGYMHLKTIDYSMSIANVNDYPYANLVLTDSYESGMDENTYIKEITISNLFVDEALDGIFGIKQDGTLERINPSNTNSTQITFKFNESVQEQLDLQEENYQREIELDPNTAKPQGVNSSDVQYRGFVVDFKDDYELLPEKSFYATVRLGYLHPYQLENGQEILNTAQLTGKMVNINGMPEGYDFGTLEVSSRFYMASLVEHATFSKITAARSALGLGTQLNYSLTLGLVNVANSTRIVNGRFVDLLPQGLDFTRLLVSPLSSPYVDGENITIIENYKNSGRTYISIPLKNNNIKRADINGSQLEVTIYAKVNEFAINRPDNTTPVVDENRNYAYFMTDNFYGPEGHIATRDFTYSGIEDKFDLTDDGDTTEKLIGSTTDIFIALPKEVIARKWIRPEGVENWISSRIETKHGQGFEYKLELTNNGAFPIDNVTIYDVLPHLDDNNYFTDDTGTLTKRMSGFSNTLTGPIVSDQADKYDIRYSTTLNSDPKTAFESTDGWLTQDELLASATWGDVKSVQIKLKPGTTLEVNEKAEFILSMQAPEFDRENLIENKVANNNFAISYDNVNWGQSNTVSNSLLNTIKIKKIWEANEADAVRVRLLQGKLEGEAPNQTLLDPTPYLVDGQEVVFELNKANEWSEFAYDLPVTNTLVDMLGYSVQEVDLVYGEEGSQVVTLIDRSIYEYTIDTDNLTYLNLTNTVRELLADITVSTKWINGEEVAKPGTTVTLMYKNAEGVFVEYLDENGNPVVATVDENGNARFVEIVSVDENGDPITFTVVQTGLEASPWKNVSIQEITPVEIFDGVALIAEGNANIEIVNEYVVPLMSVKVEKIWDGGCENRPSIPLQLSRSTDGEVWEDVIEVILNGVDDEDGDTNLWTYTFVDMPSTDLTGKSYTYKVNETTVPENYEETYSEDGLTVINKYISPKTEITLTKEWLNGPTPREDVTFILYRNIEGSDLVEVDRITLTKENLVGEENVETWSLTVGDLDLTDQNGNPYIYSVEEENVPANYEASVIDRLSILNTFVVPTSDITVTTEWLNGDDVEKPGTTVTLMVKDEEGNFTPVLDEEGNPVTTTVDEEGNATFTNVSLTDVKGNPLTFTVVQEGLEDTDWINESITEITPAYLEEGILRINSENTIVNVVNKYVAPPIPEPEPEDDDVVVIVTPGKDDDKVKPDAKPTSTPKPSQSPKTGDTGIMISVIVLIVSLTMVALVNKKKKSVN